ncbi:hypothetical protein AB0E08_08355 [Streptomyces sp. NPDC048281]|uniref:hypothetical protein n=1 Tax=Streptomyces sp. NPDC048281 TaxID=3154715 RepID=UPI0034442480
MSMGPQTSAEQADAELREAGYEPLELYPGRVTDRIKVRCVTCGVKSSLTLSHVRLGRRCGHRSLSPERAAALLEGVRLEPLEPYPGVKHVSWKTRCIDCKKPYQVRMISLPSGPRCDCTQKVKQAEAELRAAGYEPLTAYPGSTSRPWPSRCLTCQQKRRPNIDTIRAGKRCKHLTPEEKAAGGRQLR